jgi:hypothetical protein
MAIKYTNFFHSKDLQNLPKLLKTNHLATLFTPTKTFIATVFRPLNANLRSNTPQLHCKKAHWCNVLLTVHHLFAPQSFSCNCAMHTRPKLPYIAYLSQCPGHSRVLLIGTNKQM